MVEPTISAGLVSGFLDFASSQGADRAQLAEQAGIPIEQIDDPDKRIPLSRFIKAMKLAKTITGNPALALHYGEEIAMSEVSILGLIMEASATMGEAFAQLQRYGRLAIENVDKTADSRFELVQEGGQLFMVDMREYPSDFSALTEEAFVRLTCGPRRFLPEPHVLSVYFTHPTPDYHEEYKRIFKCPVHFNARWNAMEIHPDTPNWKVAQNPSYVFGVLTQRANDLLAELDASKTFRGEIETLLLSIIHQGNVSSDAVAERLNISRQTLFRKLKLEGTTFALVLDELRERLAKEYLDGRKTSVNDTAYLVGFSDPSSFSRAFKRWTGQSPGNYSHGR